MESQIAFTCGDKYLVEWKRRELRSIIKQSEVNLCFQGKSRVTFLLVNVWSCYNNEIKGKQWTNIHHLAIASIGSTFNYHTHSDGRTFKIPDKHVCQVHWQSQRLHPTYSQLNWTKHLNRQATALPSWESLQNFSSYESIIMTFQNDAKDHMCSSVPKGYF